jgi:recombinational DNA repair protein RecR
VPLVVYVYVIVFHLTMDHLSAEQRESLSKTNAERLRARLMRTGVDEEVVFAMDRATLLDALAKAIHKGPEKAGASAVEKPISIWEKELVL